MTIVMCANCHEDFDADQGACPGCGHPRVEPQGFPVGESCADCGTERLALDGRPLGRFEACVSCGSRDVRMPRKPGEVQGELREAGVAAGGEPPPVSLSSPTTEEVEAA
jgi:DNA-directed RNA polymerase subunit RPC12/RpoP